MPRLSLKLTISQQRGLRRQLRATRDARVYRRTLAILEVVRGQPLVQVALMLGVSRRMVYYWIENYQQQYDPADLHLDASPGRPPLWTRDAGAFIQRLLSHSPVDRGYPAVNWTVPLLQEELRQHTGHNLSEDSIRRELHRQGYVWKRPRYVLAPDPELERKKADSPTNSRFTPAKCGAC